MIYLRHDPNCQPTYATKEAAAADIAARESVTIEPGKVVLVPTGVYIRTVDYASLQGVPMVYELQIRARSSMAVKGIMLANGIGTIDSDYRDEIRVPLYNSTEEVVSLDKGQRIAQLCLAVRPRLTDIPVLDSIRTGGFGSTGQ